MKIARAEIENFQKITVIDISFNDRVTEISGKNGAGKSSTFLAVHAALESNAMPDDPIRHGSDSFAIRTHLKGDDDSIMLVTKRGRRDRDGKMVYDLVLETPEGARFPQPATHLKKLISDHLLDPLQFLDMTDEKQFEILRSFVPDFDFAANKRAYDGLFARRTDVGKDRKREQSAADAIDVLDEAPGEKVDESALTTELEAAGTKNLEIERRRSNREAAANRVQQLRREIEQEAIRCDNEVADIHRQIEELKTKVEAVRDKSRLGVMQASKEADELQAKLDAAEPLPDTVDAAAITTKLNEARRINRLIEDWEGQRARKVAHQRDADAYDKQYDDLTAKLADLEQARKDAIQKAHLPVSALGFGDGFVTFNGAPFAQASKAERMRIAFALCIAKRPQLRFCWIQDASLLDEDSWKFIEQLAEEFDAQVLLETVRPNSGNAIVLEDGHVKGIEAEPKLTKVAKPAAEAANDAPDAPAASTAPKPRKRWQGPGAPTGDAT